MYACVCVRARVGVFVYVASILLTQIHVLGHVYIVHAHSQHRAYLMRFYWLFTPIHLGLFFFFFFLFFLSLCTLVALHRRFRMIKCTSCAQINFLFTQIHFLSVEIFEFRWFFFRSFFFHHFQDGLGSFGHNKNNTYKSFVSVVNFVCVCACVCECLVGCTSTASKNCF